MYRRFSRTSRAALAEKNRVADSLDTVELVMALEEEFGQEIPDEEAEKLTTVGAVIEHIEGNQG